MTREAMIEIASMGEQLLVRLLKSPVTYPGMLDYIPLNLGADLPELTSSTSVTYYGQILRDALSSHSAVGNELVQLFLTEEPYVARLDFVIASPAAQNYRWETLCERDPPTFWALNERRHLKRVIPPTTIENSGLRMYSKPIRMAAFLSPAGVSSRNELNVIVAAVQAARGSGFDLEIIFYLGEQDLIDDVNVAIDANEYSGVQVRPMPRDSISIEKALKADQAQIIHFFCHGQVSAGLQLLEFASINDHDIQASVGSVQLSIERLTAVLASSGTAWLTVLNSCSGAQSARGMWSMARTLAVSGSPLAIGMAEPILDDDATLFAQGFYPQAFKMMHQATSVLEIGGVTTIDLGAALASARATLHGAVPAQRNDGEQETSPRFGRWSLPILYQREEGLKIAWVDPATRKRIETISQALRALPTDTPPDLREQILAILDKAPAVPAGLRPDSFGNLR
jgi:hypothetical protein